MSAHAFTNTRWTLVQTLHEADAPRAAKALNELCQIYWRPLYAFVRRSGRDHHEAQDLTQAFFAHLLDKNAFERADAGKSRLRNFLLGSLKNFLINDYQASQREKRGGALVKIAMDDAEQIYDAHLQNTDTPECLYEREWALTLLDQVFAELEAETIARGQERLFMLTKDALLGDKTETGYQAIAKELELSESAVKVAVHRLRRRYRQLLRRQIIDTLVDGANPDEELDGIISALRPT